MPTEHLNKSGSMDLHRTIRILIVSHSAVLYSGVAEVVRQIFSSIIQEFPNRYTVEQVGLLHLSAVTQAPWPITPTKLVHSTNGSVALDPNDLFGELTVPDIVHKFDPDIVFCHNDPQAVLPLIKLRGRAGCRWKLISYVNFDGFPVPSVFQELLRSDRIITLSEFSRQAFMRSLRNPPNRQIEYRYAPADIDRFKPPNDRAVRMRELRPAWMPESSFVLGWVGRNQWRKQTWVLYSIISLLRSGQYFYCEMCGRVSCRAQPHGTNLDCSRIGCKYVQADAIDDIYLWLHLPTGKEPGPWRLEQLEETYSVVPGRDIHYTEGCSFNHHLSAEDMPSLYHCFSALMMLSGGEGFGVPAWEAMACEVPVIYTSYSSHAELVENAGAGIGVGGLLQPEPGSGILRMIADIDQAIAAVRRLYFDRALCDTLGVKGRLYVSSFDKKRMSEEWDRCFVELVRENLLDEEE